MCGKSLFFNSFVVWSLGVFLLNTDNGLLKARTGEPLRVLFCR